MGGGALEAELLRKSVTWYLPKVVVVVVTEQAEPDSFFLLALFGQADVNFSLTYCVFLLLYRT